AGGHRLTRARIASANVIGWQPAGGDRAGPAGPARSPTHAIGTRATGVTSTAGGDLGGETVSYAGDRGTVYRPGPGSGHRAADRGRRACCRESGSRPCPPRAARGAWRNGRPPRSTCPHLTPPC